jgi:hypothetical protein
MEIIGIADSFGILLIICLSFLLFDVPEPSL